MIARGGRPGGRPADGARIQPERPLGMKKKVVPILFLNDQLPVDLSLILRLVVTAMKRNTRSKFDRHHFHFSVPSLKKGRCGNKVFIFSQAKYTIKLHLN